MRTASSTVRFTKQAGAMAEVATKSTLTLPTERWGNGPINALFLHGFTGNKDSFRHLEPLLGSEISATCVDLPGHGSAGIPEQGVGFKQVIDALAALIPKPIAVVGYSQGARIALALAAHYPEKITKLVLESGTPGFRRKRDRVARWLKDRALSRRIQQIGVAAFVQEWESLPLFASFARLPAAVRDNLRARRLANSAQGLIWALTHMGQGAQPSYWAALPELRRPVLLLVGEHDTSATRLARRMEEGVPLAWHRVFASVGHAPHLECPEAYAEEVRNFLGAPWETARSEVVP